MTCLPQPEHYKVHKAVKKCGKINIEFSITVIIMNEAYFSKFNKTVYILMQLNLFSTNEFHTKKHSIFLKSKQNINNLQKPKLKKSIMKYF